MVLVHICRRWPELRDSGVTSGNYFILCVLFYFNVPKWENIEKSIRKVLHCPNAERHSDSRISLSVFLSLPWWCCVVCVPGRPSSNVNLLWSHEIDDIESCKSSILGAKCRHRRVQQDLREALFLTWNLLHVFHCVESGVCPHGDQMSCFVDCLNTTFFYPCNFFSQKRTHKCTFASANMLKAYPNGAVLFNNTS